MEVRYGRENDFAWLHAQDGHVGAEWSRRCLSQGEYLVAEDRQDRAGFVRFSMFWGAIPFMDLIWVMDGHRGHGVGSALFHFWETEMRMRGAQVLMTSSMSDEPEPQMWHRRNGFRECGQLTFGQQQQVPEVFFVKDLA